jgi:hypothetical protein
MFDDLLNALKEYLGIEPDDTSQDAELLRALNLAGSVCETYLDRVIAKREVGEHFQSYFGRVTLHHTPVDHTADVTVTLDGVEMSGFEVYEERWKLPHLTRQGMQMDMPLDWRKYDRVTVTYTAGYDPIPDDLAQALVYVAADLFASQGTGTLPGGGGSSGAVKSMSIHDVGSITYDVGNTNTGGGGSISSFGLINETATHLLSKYKRMNA